ncbi:hypothetical protein [Pseudomonas sp. EL_65y_Pfl2_R96]|uniref:hypothetical protein n=1 Tax=Pseudomonas sp. EL_65y_Pfl2_R96 TaxID=3088699 RepID=UPI0030DC7E7D
MSILSKLRRQLSAIPSSRKIVIICLLSAVLFVIAAFKDPALYQVLGFPQSAAEWVRPHVMGIVGLSIFAWLLSNMQSIHRYSLVKLPAADHARYVRLKNCLQRITLREEVANARQHLQKETQLLERQHGFMLDSAGAYRALRILSGGIAVICSLWTTWLLARGVEMRQLVPFVEWMR